MTYEEILAARQPVYRHLRRTPLHPYPGLSELVGADVWVKHENHQVVGSFKVRGGVNLGSLLTSAERQAGLFTGQADSDSNALAEGPESALSH